MSLFSEVSYGGNCAATMECVDPFTECNTDGICACVTGYTEIGSVCYQGLYDYRLINVCLFYIYEPRYKKFAKSGNITN